MTQYNYKGKIYNSYNDLQLEKYRRMLWVKDNVEYDDNFLDRFLHIINYLHANGIMVNGKDMQLNQKTSPW